MNRIARIFLVTCLAISLNSLAFGQSQFALRNGYVVDAPVFDAMGNRLSGPTFLAELWGGANSNSLAPAVNFDQALVREIVPFGTGALEGYVLGPGVVVTNVAPSGSAWLQLRAWDSRLGATYEQVAALAIGGYGESLLFYVQGSNPYPPADPPAPLIGLQPFSLLPVIPEPNSSALLWLGLGLLFRGRRSEISCRRRQP
jgi:hypothetical protein